METLVYINAYAAIGVLTVWAVLTALSLLALHFGKRVWRRLRLVYHLTVIEYWPAPLIINQNCFHIQIMAYNFLHWYQPDFVVDPKIDPVLGI